MSTLKDNIRRIADTEELRKLIAELLNEGEIGDKDGIKQIVHYASVGTNGAIQSSGGAPSSDVGSTESQPQSGDDASSEQGGNDIPDGEGVDASAFERSAQDIFDNGLKVGDKLKGITGLEDCTSGNSGELRLDDYFLPPIIADLTDYTASDWDDGNDPRESQWRSGVFYELTALTTHKDTNPYAVVEAALSEYDTNDPPNAPHTLNSIEEYDIDAKGDGTNITATIGRALGVDALVNVTIRKSGCTIGVDAWCPSTQPTNDWPEDDIHQLKFDGGQFQTNQYEPLADQNGPWQNNPSKISACTSGGDNMSFEGTNDGGMLINIDSGVDSGTSYVLNRDGVVVAKTTDTSSYLPSDS